MQQRQRRQISRWPAYIAMVVVAFAFMMLSLTVTAIGTARFLTAMGYSPLCGWMVGVVFDVAKETLPLVLRALWGQRAYLVFAALGVAWVGLFAYSALATHATVSAAIVESERSGALKMRSRSGSEAELISVEQQMAALAEPKVPRPSKAVREALAAEKVPAGAWRDSKACLSIRDSNYFQKACGRYVALRGELAAAQEYERTQ